MNERFTRSERICKELQDAAAEFAALSLTVERYEDALHRIAEAEHQFHPVAGYIYPDKIENWAREALGER